MKQDPELLLRVALGSQAEVAGSLLIRRTMGSP